MNNKKKIKSGTQLTLHRVTDRVLIKPTLGPDPDFTHEVDIKLY